MKNLKLFTKQCFASYLGTYLKSRFSYANYKTGSQVWYVANLLTFRS